VSGTPATDSAICEVVVAHDVRARRAILSRRLLHRYYVRRSISIALLVAIDVAAVVAAVELAPLLWGLVGVAVETPTMAEMLWAALIVIGVQALTRMYSLREERARLVPFLRANLAILLVIGLVMLLTYNSITSQSAVYIWVFFVLFSGVGRWLYNSLLKGVYGHIVPRRPVVVIGRPDHAERLAELFARYPAADALRIDGIVEGMREESPPADGDAVAAQAAAPRSRASLAETDGRTTRALRCLGDLDSLEDVVERWRPMEIVVSDPELVRERMFQLMDLCRRQRLTLRMAAPGLQFDGASVSFVPGFGMPVFLVRTTIGRPYEYEAKRAFDILSAGLLLLLLSPLMAAIAIAIKLGSPGPVFYRSVRVGLGQRPFQCLKFRTMKTDAERLQADLERQNQASGALFKIKDDPRVTRVGRLLRRTSLDELPQLINVFRGEMSLVGPRPLPLRDNELMEDWHMRRHVVLPGLTGLWQVSGRSDLSFDRMIELDFKYIESWTFFRDLSILVRTAGVVLFRRGAY